MDDARRYGTAIRWRDRAQGIGEPVPPVLERLLDWPMVGWIRQAMDEFKVVAEAGSGAIVMVREGRGRAQSGRTGAEALIDEGPTAQAARRPGGGDEACVFAFGELFCVLCDRQVSKRQARRLSGWRYIAVCNGWRERWQRSGAICARCRTAVLGETDLGIFLDWHVGHLDCGTARFDDAPDDRMRADAVSN